MWHLLCPCRADGTGPYSYIDSSTTQWRGQYVIPADLRCERCILQVGVAGGLGLGWACCGACSLWPACSSPESRRGP